jgi:aminoglycoside phosphotransferase family enzyme/predicted kinase
MTTNSSLPPLIQGLLRPEAYPEHIPEPVELVETHISWVLLAGQHAYKVKKPVNFGFLNFSTLEMRKAACLEELRINKRYSPDLYIAVTPICGTPPFCRIGAAGNVVDYAVVMARFTPHQTFDQLASSGRLTPDHIDLLADLVARFHLSLPPAAQQAGNSAVNHSDHFVTANFEHLGNLVGNEHLRRSLDHLAEWTQGERVRREKELIQRCKRGHIRECHGDLHLGNVVLIDDKVRLFDGIEFSPDLRWIDTISEVAFPVMDLEVKGRPDLAYRFLNRYLELTGDHGGMCMLDYYRLYRAMVRAKVASLRRQQSQNHDERAACEEQLQRYINYGLELIQPKQPCLIIMHGLSGSGKSVLASELAKQLPAISLRSDVERKRLQFPKSTMKDVSPTDIYHPAMIRATYERLLARAKPILESGHNVILDATHLRQEWREQAHQLAKDCHAGFHIVDCQAPVEVLQARTQARQRLASDPSDADVAVLMRQIEESEPLREHERCKVITVDTTLADPTSGILRSLVKGKTLA